jgi:hypothetical protein
MAGRGQQFMAGLGIASILGVGAVTALEKTTGFATEFLDSVRQLGSSASQGGTGVDDTPAGPTATTVPK